MREDGIYEMTCDRGHQTTTLYGMSRYEIIFEMGIDALVDGYTREAVTSFATALERFHEFASRALILGAGGDKEVWDSARKMLSRASERQYGAFVALHVAMLKFAPAVLSAGQREFRNDVVHNGVIPSDEQAIGFGEAVRIMIVKTICDIDEKLPPDSNWQALFWEEARIFEKRPDLRDRRKFSRVSRGSTVGLARMDPPPTLAEIVESRRNARLAMRRQ